MIRSTSQARGVVSALTVKELVIIGLTFSYISLVFDHVAVTSDPVNVRLLRVEVIAVLVNLLHGFVVPVI